MTRRLYVGNLPDSALEDDLFSLFSRAGTVVSVTGARDPGSGRPTGFALVEMGSDAQAHRALEMFDGYSIDDNRIEVKVSLERAAPGGSPHGAGHSTNEVDSERW